MAKWANDYPVALMCRVLRVTKSAYYDWRQHGATVVGAEEFMLYSRMKALFAQSRESLGSRGMVRQLRKDGHVMGRYRVRRLMKRLGLTVKIKRKYRVTTQSKHDLPVAGNVLNRQFNPGKPDQAWVADITYVWTVQGWLYLAVVMDLCSRRVIGWCMDRTMTQALAIRALMMAINLRQPKAGLIHHSDRGSQYASAAYQTLLTQQGIRPSMSRKGNCWDNAVMERFFKSYKEEWIGDRVYHTREAAIRDMQEYMKYYDSVRLHSTLGYRTPMEYENGLNGVSGLG
jgi:transposase InsO family protein